MLIPLPQQISTTNPMFVPSFTSILGPKMKHQLDNITGIPSCFRSLALQAGISMQKQQYSIWLFLNFNCIETTCATQTWSLIYWGTKVIEKRWTGHLWSATIFSAFISKYYYYPTLSKIDYWKITISIATYVCKILVLTKMKKRLPTINLNKTTYFYLKCLDLHVAKRN